MANTWVFDNNDILQVHKITASKDAISEKKLLDFFEFEVHRYKDKVSKQEQLEIYANFNGDDYGKVNTDIISIESEIIKLKSNGIILSRLEYIELSKLILDNYYLLEETIVDGIDSYLKKDIVKEIFKVFCHYIHDNNIKSVENKNKLNLYYVGVNEFSTEFMACQYHKYGCTNAKESLRELEYVHCNEGRNDYVAVINDKREKVIAFYADKVDKVQVEKDEIDD